MDLSLETIDHIAVVRVPGNNLEANNAQAFKDAMAPVIQAHHRIVLDMGQLQFIDSSGLGAILSCLKQLHARNGVIKLCNVSKPIQSLFDIVRMNRVFSIYDIKEAAVASFK